MHHFPFGALASPVRQAPLAAASIFVLGVYASAVHAKWLNPDGSIRVKALAVASEPNIFWRGESAAEIISGICVPPEAGRLVAAAGNLNGPSGVWLDSHYLRPLGLTRVNAWLCDLLPESRQNDAQAHAVRRHYEPLRERLGLPRVSIPPVPRQFACGQRTDQIVDEFLSSGATTLVTLGDKPLEEFVGRLRLLDKTSISAFGRTEAEYGRLHPFTLQGRRLELLPLVHPRQAARLGPHDPGLSALHAAWVRRCLAERPTSSSLG
jgi:hypothetical protein